MSTSPPPGGLTAVASGLLDELAAHRRAEAEIHRRRRAARERGINLIRAFDALVRTLPAEEQRPLLRRLDAIEGRAAPPPNALGSTPVTGAVLAFLAAHEAETVTVPALNEHLAALGITEVKTHASITLSRYVRQGIVARVRRGVYRINRFHPELVAMREGAG